ncbi:MAG: hypothetical protein ABFE13_01910 [Phycisphaerales bacterium]
MSFLSDASYKSFLDARIASLDDPVLRDHVTARFDGWGRQYYIHRLTERAAELLMAETGRPNMLYLRDEADLDLLRVLAARHRFDARVFRGFLVEERLWEKLQPEWFEPFGVCRTLDWDDRENTIVFTLSDATPLRNNGRDKGNDFLERFIDLRRFQKFVQARESLQGRAAVALYVDYKRVQTLSAIAEQVGRQRSGRWKTMALLDHPDARMTGYDLIVSEPFYYLWPLIFHALHPDIFHINVGWGTQGMPFVPFVKDRDSVVVDFYDVLALVPDEALVRGHHRESPTLTRTSGEFLFRHFDNIVHRYAESINPQLKQQFQREMNLVSVYEYVRDPVCSRPARESDAIRLVYGGDLAIADLPADPLYQWTEGMMRHFTGANLHLYLYPNPASTNFQRSAFLEELARTLGVSNVHSCVPLREDEYVQAICEYDYGLIGPTPEDIRPVATGYGLPFKVLTYLRAGLPIVVPEDFTMAADIVCKHKIGVVYSYDELDRIPQLLGSQDIRRLKANVIQRREQFRIEKGVAKILRLYDGMLSKRVQGTPDVPVGTWTKPVPVG